MLYKDRHSTVGYGCFSNWVSTVARRLMVSYISCPVSAVSALTQGTQAQTQAAIVWRETLQILYNIYSELTSQWDFRA